MKYREFIEALQKELEERLGEAAILFQKVTKNNEVTKDCFLISEAGYDISPAVYIEEYYRAYPGRDEPERSGKEDYKSL